MFSWAVTTLAEALKRLNFEIDVEKKHPLYDKLSRSYKTTAMLSPTLRKHKHIEPSLAVMQKDTLLRIFGSAADTS